MNKLNKYFLLLSCLLLLGGPLMGQPITVSGKVTEATEGLTLPGVTVRIQGTNIGVITDLDGRYTIQAPPDATLVFTFIGLKTVEKEVMGQTIIDVEMESDLIGLDEFVVVGYGVQRKREVTGAISQVRGEDIASLAAPSFDGLLAGRSAGVQVSIPSGVIGEAPRIRIRGVSSITSGNDPLIVVDGIPLISRGDNDNLPGSLGGFARVNSLGDINPNDIESIEILKDGSATAIYGSRASNGVILITTKRGQMGQFKVHYNNWVGIAQPVKYFSLTNEDQFVELANEMFYNVFKATNQNSEVKFEPVAFPAGLNTDWQQAVMQKALQHDHNLSLSGATSQTNYYLSVGYGYQEGITRTNDMERFTIRANLDQKANDWLSFGTNLSVSRSDYNDLLRGANNLSGSIFSAIRQLPNTPIYDISDPTGYNIDNINRGLVGPGVNTRTIDDNLPNIIYVIDHNVFRSKVLRTIASSNVQINITQGLFFRSQLGADFASTEGLLYYDPVHGDGMSTNGRIHNSQTNIRRWNYQNVLSYINSLGNNHFNITLVNEYQKEVFNRFGVIGTDLSSTHFRYNFITGTVGSQAATGSIFERGFVSYAARINYNFDDRFYLQGSFRSDGISQLPKENRWGLFPGASIGWTISRESFMHNINFISDLKLRASYAQVGNVDIGTYPYAGLYGSARYGDNTGIAFDQMGNDQLKWESSKKWDIGFDMSINEGKHQITFDYFLNNQDGLILSAPTPPSLGIPGNSINRNIGSMKNWGYELSVTSHVIAQTDFSWILGANLTLSQNEVINLVEGQPITGSFWRIAEGESIRSIYGYDYFGVNPANGNPIYITADGTLVQGNIPTQSYRLYDPSNPSDISHPASLTGNDRKIFGPSIPTYYGAIHSNLRYKQFDFSTMFRFSGGNYIMNRTRADLTANSFTNFGTEMLGRWKSPEEPGDGWTPILWHGRTNFINIQGSTNGRFVEKGDFIRLSSLVVGYTLKANMLQRIRIDRLRIFVQGSDLFVITEYTGIDPEMEVTRMGGLDSSGVDFNVTPRQRTFTVGVNLSL